MLPDPPSALSVRRGFTRRAAIALAVCAVGFTLPAIARAQDFRADTLRLRVEVGARSDWTTEQFYEDTFTDWLRDGHLARLDLAFSRDQAEKIYVQHRMTEQAAELWAWLESGAHFYVCGDASRMAKDVDAALHKVIETAGGKSAEEAVAYVAKLKADKRYQRDVY